MGATATTQKYLLKEGEYAEKGEQVLCAKGMENVEGVQGKRNDLDEIEELLNSGATPDEIFEMAFRYRKFEKMIRAAYLAKRIKEMPLKKEMYQMMRRFNVIVYHYINKDGKYRTFSMPGIDYVDAADMVKKAMENEKTADEREEIAAIKAGGTQESLEEIMKGFGMEEVKDEHD